jgi:type VI secretion system protein ImpA
VADLSIDVDSLLAPIGGETACGPNLEYDPQTRALEEAARGKPEQQFGDTLIPAVEPEWAAVADLAAELLGRSKDLRPALHLTRAWLRMEGYGGFARGLALLRGLLDQYWDTLYPQLDPDDGLDPVMRLNALAPLADPTGLLLDLRRAPLAVGKGPAFGLRVRDLELAFGKVTPEAGESAPSEQGALEAIAQLLKEVPQAAGFLTGAQDDIEAIAAVLDERAGAMRGPDLEPIRRCARAIAQAVKRATGSADATPAPGEAAPGAPAAGAAAGGAIRSREDVLRLLDQVCDWIARNEPSHPAPLVIRRAQRLMKKDFIQIIQDLAPDSIHQVEAIVGTEEARR